MKYIVKTTYTATAEHPNEKEGATQVWYTGKGNTLTRNLDDIINERYGYSGWTRRHFAEKDIKSEIEFYNRRPNHAWNIEYEILTY